jgi:hypothetical protein
LFGLPIDSPQVIVERVVSDLGAIARLARSAPGQLDRLLALGEEITAIGYRVLELGERIDRRAEALLEAGDRIDRRADAMLAAGEGLDGRAAQLVELGASMRELGRQIDARGAEIVDRATRVADTGGDLIAVLPTLERAIAMATPLEGAIDRFGRLVDRLPGGTARRRGEQPELRAPSDHSPDPGPHPDDR